MGYFATMLLNVRRVGAAKAKSEVQILTWESLTVLNRALTSTSFNTFVKGWNTNYKPGLYPRNGFRSLQPCS